MQSIPKISSVVGSEKGWRQIRFVHADGDLQTDGRIAAHVSERSPHREDDVAQSRGRHHLAWNPPSMLRMCPVTKLASSDSRKQIPFAISSDRPRRFIGCIALMLASL